MARQLVAIFEHEQTLFAEVVASWEVHLGHVAGDDMLQRAAEGAETTLEHTDDINVAAEMLELRVYHCHLSKALLLRIGVCHCVSKFTVLMLETVQTGLLFFYFDGRNVLLPVKCLGYAPITLK